MTNKNCMRFPSIGSVCRMFAASVCVFLLGIGGCKKDDDANANAFHFDGATRGLRSALLLYASSPENAADGTIYYQNIFMLLSTGLATDGHTVTGQGDAIELSVYCASQNMDDGTYTFTGSQAAPNTFEIQAGRVQLESADNSPSPQVHSFSSGQMTVARSGRNYAIDLAGAVNGKILKAHFFGTLTTLQKN